ncbi:hypothetical protein BD779DRAFT_1542653 [Infundibulicybe gibba]|nr:hypothetical protein BD779DRAFT_1542653 [Infundibulicybe gibba]
MPCPNCSCHSCRALIGSPISSADKFPPPPSELTTTNLPPTDPEVVHSRNAIRSAERAVPLIQAMIDDLKRRKAKLLRLVRMRKAVISPLRSFPPELLANIFAAFVTIAPQSSSPLLVLMGVCSRWRRIVLDTPQLWTKITRTSLVIDSWIVRSKELPLHLDLDLDAPGSNRVLETLIPHAHRWEYVDFSLGPNSLSVLAGVRTHLHSLKRLNLDLDRNTTETMDFCEVAPQLTDVRLRGVDEPISIKLPWEQLRTCTIDDDGLALYALQHAKNLQTFHLDMAYFPAEGAWLSMLNDPHCRHTRLRTLIIHWSSSDPEPVNSFVSSITLPSLRTLEIDFDSSPFESDSDYNDYGSSDRSDSNSSNSDITDDRSEIALITLSGFLERSSPHLSTLTLAGIPSSPDRLIWCLAQVPSLVSLSIQFDDWHTINNKVLFSLNVNLLGYILPRLHSLSLRGRSKFSEELLDAVVASRREINPANQGVALLEDLTLSARPKGPGHRPASSISPFRAGGLNVTYGKGWSIYNSIQADISESLAEGQA